MKIYEDEDYQIDIINVQKRFDLLVEETKMFIFNNNFLELNHLNDKEQIKNKLKHYVSYKQTSFLKESNKFNFNEIFSASSFDVIKKENKKEIHCKSFNILDNGSYFVVASSKSYSSLENFIYMAVYDPIF